MNIVEIVNSLEFGGTERLVVNLATSLRELGHQVGVICLRGKGPLAQPLERAGIAIEALEKPEGPSWRALRRLSAHLRQHRVDIVHTHNPLVHHYGVIGGRMAGVPILVSTIHGIRNISPRIGMREIIYSAACRYSDQVVAVCPMAYRTFRAGRVIPKRKLIAINNGIPLDDFLKVEPRGPSNELVFGIVGRLEAVKDHASLLEAFALLAGEYPHCRLEILGDGPERGQLERFAAELGISDSVVFHGFRADVAEFLKGIDVAVLCSLSESLPLGLLEAMAAGKPIIGTAVGGVPDLVQDGECGWLCAPGRPPDLAAAMRRAIQTDIPQLRGMGARGREHAKNYYSLPKMTEEYERLFERLLFMRASARRSARAGNGGKRTSP